MKINYIKSILIVLLVIAMIAISGCSSPLFADVIESSTYYNDIKSVVDLGLMDNKDENFFAPNSFISYAEIVKIAANIHQIKMNSTAIIDTDGEYSDVYIAYCVSNGIIEREYSWSDNVTRAECIDIFSRVVLPEELNEINTVEDGSIPDVSMDSEYYDSIYLFYRAGIYQGTDELYRCKPDGSVKRYEVACMIRRLLDSSVRYNFSLMLSDDSSDVNVETDKVGSSADTTPDVNNSDVTTAETEKQDPSIQTGNTAETTGPNVSNNGNSSSSNTAPETSSKDTTSPSVTQSPSQNTSDNSNEASTTTPNNGNNKVDVPGKDTNNTVTTRPVVPDKDPTDTDYPDVGMPDDTTTTDQTESDVTEQNPTTPENPVPDTTDKNNQTTETTGSVQSPPDVPDSGSSVPDVPSQDTTSPDTNNPTVPDKEETNENLELIPMDTPLGTIKCPARSKQYITTSMTNFSNGLRGDVFCTTSSGKVKIASIYLGVNIPYGTFIGYYKFLSVHVERFWPTLDSWSAADKEIYNTVQNDYTFCVTQVEALLSQTPTT